MTFIRMKHVCCLAHYQIQYGLIGNSVEVRCLVDSRGKSYTAYAWDYKKDEHKASSKTIEISLLSVC